MQPRFYAPDAHEPGQIVTLMVDEAAHLTRVLRLREGHAVRAFDGRGLEFDAVVEHTARTDVRLRLGPARAPAAERQIAVTLAQAVLKGDKMDGVVRDAAMIGVAAVQPFVCTRSETTLAALSRGRRRERWERIAVASVKQCGRAVVPRVLETCTLAALKQMLAMDVAPGQAFMLVEPETAATPASLGEVPPDPPRAAAVVVGPEGGWTSDEIAEMSAHTARRCGLDRCGGGLLCALGCLRGLTSRNGSRLQASDSSKDGPVRGSRDRQDFTTRSIAECSREFACLFLKPEAWSPKPNLTSG